MTPQPGLAAVQFIALPDEEGKIRELDEGKLIERGPAELHHGIAVSFVASVLDEQVDKSQAAFWAGVGCGFRLGPGTFRIPDVFVILKSSAASMSMFGGWHQGAPGPVVEVASASDNASDSN